jgi:nicotinamidase-related amidase
MSDAAKTALLVMDAQMGIIDRIGTPDLVERLKATSAGARRAGVKVIYVTIRFRPGAPEVSRRNAAFASMGSRYIEGDHTFDVHAEIAPQEGDIMVVKRRVSAFAGSDLEMVLRAQAVETIVLTGVATSGVVLSTLRQAADLDYRIVVLEDCCADRDPEVHEVLMHKLFPRQAEVLNHQAWLASLG